MLNDHLCERELISHDASFLMHYLHLHRALWRCDVVFESDVCLTYCVPLVDSLCSFVRVQHVFGVAGVNVFRKESFVRACVRVHNCNFLMRPYACVCANHVKEKSLFKRTLSERAAIERVHFEWRMDTKWCSVIFFNYRRLSSVPQFAIVCDVSE